jgi:hypothetical protein
MFGRNHNLSGYDIRVFEKETPGNQKNDYGAYHGDAAPNQDMRRARQNVLHFFAT